MAVLSQKLPCNLLSSLNIFDILLYYYTCLCATFFMTSPLWFAPSLCKEDYLHIFKCVSFWVHGFCGKSEGCVTVNRLNHTSWIPVVTPTDRPNSVRNHCVIEVLRWRFCGVHWFSEFSVGIRVFVIGLSQISFFYSYNCIARKLICEVHNEKKCTSRFSSVHWYHVLNWWVKCNNSYIEVIYLSLNCVDTAKNCICINLMKYLYNFNPLQQ